MLLAMARDIRVILIKLADRTHNMRTLGHLRPEKQIEIAQETLDIYAPLAHRLGIYGMKSELEDNALRFLHPEVYYQLKRSVAKKKAERERYIRGGRVGPRAQADGGRARRRRGARPAEALLLDLPEDAGAEPALRSDLRPDRVPRHRRLASASATRRSASCTRAGSRCPGASRTTSRVPKTNGYQSLHTTVIGPYGERIEIQIRTREMHRVAEYGIAAHWRYKSAGTRGGPDTDQRFAWLRQMLEWQHHLSGSRRVPAHGEGGPLQRGGVRLHAEGRSAELPGRLHGHRLRLPHPLRGRAATAPARG